MDFLLNILSHWDSVLAVLVVLGGLIFFHELGHFGMARLLGMGVRTFSLGFGPKLLTFRRGKTDYCLSLIPLGGYVALAGEEDDEEPRSSGESKDIDGIVFDANELFSERPAWNRLLVVLAGPVANFALALVICWVLALAQGETYRLPVVGSVLAESPAAAAGVQPGDTIVQIDAVSINTWDQVMAGVGAGNGKPLHLVLLRDGEERSLVVTPEAKTRPNLFGEMKPAWLIGISDAGKIGTTPLGVLDAISSGTIKTWDMIAFTCESFVKLFQRVVPLDNVGGPILIAQMIGQQAENGLLAVLMLAALISVNLGILNLLPIPVLDGGHIVFLTLEMILRHPVSLTARNMAARVGMALLLCLMLLATWNDLVRLFS
ncbi:MAG: RIP metalloprotease RseP [Bilophila sp.]